MRTIQCAAICACLATVIGGCAGSRRPDPHTIAPTSAGGQVQGRTTLSMPISIPGQSTIIIPFAIESEKDWYQASDPFDRGGLMMAASARADSDSGAAYSSRAWYGGGSVRWHNAIFRDPRSGEEWALLDRRGVISAWNAHGPPPPKDQPFKARVLVFLATLEDTNHDGTLNSLDARVAIITDGDGRNARTVSPANAQVQAVSYDAASDRLYLKVVSDTNGDGKFTFEDKPVPYVYDLASGGMAAPVVSEGMIRQVEALLK